MTGLVLAFIVCVIIVALLGVHAIWTFRKEDENLTLKAELMHADRPSRHQDPHAHSTTAPASNNFGDDGHGEKGRVPPVRHETSYSVFEPRE